MCGLSGVIFSYSSQIFLQDKDNFKNIFLNSAGKIVHRGSQPLKHEFKENVYVAHSRLAFQDLSPNSSQPLWSADKQWVLIFNGEIYNYQSLRQKIINEFSYPFSSTGDSEVILAGFLCYKEKILDLLEGEYSFVIFKADGTEVFAGRDPFGVKPLFVWAEDVNTHQFAVAHAQYRFESSAMGFASEIKGLACSKIWDKEGFLRQAVGLYEPIRTPFQNVFQVPGGSFLWGKRKSEDGKFSITLKLDETALRRSAWTPWSSHGVTDGMSSPGLTLSSPGLTRGSRLDSGLRRNDRGFSMSSPGMTRGSSFYNVMRDSIEERLVSDVELGVYLSSGIDSKFVSAILSQLYAEKKIKTPVKSFTVGFDVEAGFDEAADAVQFAKAANLNPHVCRVNYKDLHYAYPIAVYHSENVQPYTNGAAKWWLSRFARKHVQGVLTGDGADEVLCGYPSFRYAAWWKFIFKNRSGSSVFDKLKNHPLGSNWRDEVYVKRFVGHGKNPWLSGSSHAGSGIDFIESLQVWGVAHPLFGQIKATAELLLGKETVHDWLLKQRESVSSWFKFGFSENENFYTNPENALLLWQNYFCKTHLPVQVLNWVGDRMEMANTLEGRPPFLSKKLKNFVYNLSDLDLVNGFEEKSILQKSFKKCFPEYRKFLPVEKKQFNAPFLMTEEQQSNLESAIQFLKEGNLIENAKISSAFFKSPINTDVYQQTYLNATAQTLLSFYYVNEFIGKNQNPERDFDYEESVCDCVA